MAPEAGVQRDGTVGPRRLDDAEEVLQAVLAGPGVALDVEEQVAGRRCREGGEAPRRHRRRRRIGRARGHRALGSDGLGRQQLVADRAVGALGELEARLVPEPVDEVEPHAVDLAAVGARRQEGAGGDTGAGQLGHRIGADPGDEAQVVLGAPRLVARRQPGAHLAVADGHGIARHERAVDRRLEALPHHAVIGDDVVGPVAVVLTVTGDHDELARPRALQPGHLLGIAAQLHERCRLGAPRELRVRHVVGPRPEARGSGHLEEEVGVAAPAPVEERGLEHHVDARLHEPQRLRLGRHQRLGRGARRRHLADGETGGPEALELVALVLVTTTSEDLELRVVAIRSLELAGEQAPLALRRVLASEVGDEVARAQDRAGAGPVHGQTILPRGCDDQRVGPALQRAGAGSRHRRGTCRTRSRTRPAWR